MKKNIFALILICLVFLIAFLIRIQSFIKGDFYFLLDQSRDMMLVKEIIVTHKLPLIGARAGFGGLFHGPLWLYMIVPFFLLSSGNPFFSLVPLFILVSMAIVVSGFFIGSKLYGTKIGVILALLLALASPLIDTVAFTTNAEVMPLVFLLYLYVALEFIRGKNIYFIFMLFAAGIGMHFESAFAIFLIPLAILAVIARWKKLSIKIVGWGILAFLIAVGNFLLFELRHQFLMTHAIRSLLFVHQKPMKGFERYANIFFRIQDRAIMLRDSFLLPFLNQNSLIYIFVAGIILVSFILFIRQIVVKKKLDREYLFIFLIPFVIYPAYVFYPFPLWGHYTISMAIFSAVILVLSIKNILETKIGLIFILLFLIILSNQAISWILPTYQSEINQKTYTTDSDGSFHNQLAVVKWIFQDTGNTSFGYFVYNPQVLTYNMDYLMWYEGKKNHISFSNVKHDITYLIMYAGDPKDVHAHDFWKKNVVRTSGNVIEKVVLRGDITVEKLQIPKGEGPADPNYYQNLTFR